MATLSPSPQHVRASGRATLQRAGALPLAIKKANAFRHRRRLHRHLAFVITNPSPLPQLCLRILLSTGDSLFALMLRKIFLI